jgi:hypothetical protein
MKAAPSTLKVWATPANVSEFEIEVTSNEPAATVPATPIPLKICAEAKVLRVRP